MDKKYFKLTLSSSLQLRQPGLADISVDKSGRCALSQLLKSMWRALKTSWINYCLIQLSRNLHDEDKACWQINECPSSSLPSPDVPCLIQPLWSSPAKQCEAYSSADFSKLHLQCFTHYLFIMGLSSWSTLSTSQDAYSASGLVPSSFKNCLEERQTLRLHICARTKSSLQISCE